VDYKWETRSLALGIGIVSALDMMSFYADWFISLGFMLSEIQRIYSDAKSAAHALGDKSAATEHPAPAELRNRMKLTHRNLLEAAELHMTLKSFDRVVEAADDPTLTLHNVSEYAQDLHLRLADELALCSFWQVPREYQQFLDPDLFGSQVANAFPSARPDIEEAGNCLAFGRATACVFHLMRVVEHGLRALARNLSDDNLNPSRNPSWDAILKKCEAEQRKPVAERSAEWRAADNTFVSEIIATVRAIKDGWRNPSLHVERSYTPDQAKEIFIAVRAFMRRLAEKLSE
jgi:hypothetical protein